MKAPKQAPDTKSAWNIYFEMNLGNKTKFTKSPRRSMLSGKLSRKWSLKLKKMMFDGPFLIKMAVRPLKTKDVQNYKQTYLVHILFKLLLVMCTCSILEHQGRNRRSGRHVVCFETVQNTSEENLSCNIILPLFICIQSLAKNLPCNITIRIVKV